MGSRESNSVEGNSLEIKINDKVNRGISNVSSYNFMNVHLSVVTSIIL